MRVRWYIGKARGHSGTVTGPWYVLFRLRLAKLIVQPPTTGYRLWFFCRWRVASYIDVVLDRGTW